MLFVVGLRHNLPSVSWIYDKGNDVIFKKYGCEIRRADNKKLVFVGTRTTNNLHTLTKTIKGSCVLGEEDVN